MWTSYAAVTAHLTGPYTARIGSSVTFTASGVPSGTYTMRLAIQTIPPHVVSGTVCAAQVGRPMSAGPGQVTIGGRLPARLACRSGAGPVEGYYMTRAGTHYKVTVSRNAAGLPFGGEPFLTHPLRITA